MVGVWPPTTGWRPTCCRSGREIDKTDGMLQRFEAAADAVGYALAYHRALGSLEVPLKAWRRLAMSGRSSCARTARLTPRGAAAGGEWPGQPTTARVMALAQGASFSWAAQRDARRSLGEVPWALQSTATGR